MTDVSSIYKQGLEEDIIAKLSEAEGISLEAAMDVYYRSRLAQQISEGCYGIEYLSSSRLVDDLIENEPSLFA